MKNQIKNAICFGEILWDIFPDGKKLGGAPLNVANRIAQNGVDATIISAVGRDSLGQAIRSAISEMKVKSLIQTHNSLPTGTVEVVLNSKGSASYTIVEPVAWDAINLEAAIKADVQNCDCLIFGSLATRNEISRKTLAALLPIASFRVFDVNLRPPHYDYKTINELMRQADLVKLNEEELLEIVNQLGGPTNNIEKQVQFIADFSQTDQLCVTLGEKGALWFKRSKFIYQSGFPITVKDTVGAGDSFLGTLVTGLLLEEKPEKTLAKACAMGALVASKSGANPQIHEEELTNLLRQQSQ